MDLPALATSGKKMKANKAVFHDLLTLPKNETLTPNFSYKVSNSDTLKPLSKVVETPGKIVNGQPNVCMQNLMRMKAGPISETYQASTCRHWGHWGRRRDRIKRYFMTFDTI